MSPAPVGSSCSEACWSAGTHRGGATLLTYTTVSVVGSTMLWDPSMLQGGAEGVPGGEGLGEGYGEGLR